MNFEIPDDLLGRVADLVAERLRDDPPEARSPWLTVEQAAEQLCMSPRQVHELTRSRSIPMVKRRGMRRVLLPAEGVHAWMEGAPLEVVETDDSVIVRVSGVRA